MALNFLEIDNRRQAAGVSVYGLCQKAHVSPLTYRRLKTQRTKRPWPSTLARLDAALGGQRVAPPRKLSSEQIRPYFNLVLAYCCRAAGLSHFDIVATDPHANRPRDLNWLAAIHARQVAIYVLNTESNIRCTDIAKALGVTKQAISKTLKAMEDKRDEPAFEALMQRIHEIMHQENAA